MSERSSSMVEDRVRQKNKQHGLTAQGPGLGPAPAQGPGLGLARPLTVAIPPTGAPAQFHPQAVHATATAHHPSSSSQQQLHSHPESPPCSSLQRGKAFALSAGSSPGTRASVSPASPSQPCFKLDVTPESTPLPAPRLGPAGSPTRTRASYGGGGGASSPRRATATPMFSSSYLSSSSTSSSMSMNRAAAAAPANRSPTRSPARQSPLALASAQSTRTTPRQPAKSQVASAGGGVQGGVAVAAPGASGLVPLFDDIEGKVGLSFLS